MKTSISKIYFMIVSFVSMVGLTVSLGIGLYNLAERYIITDGEYMLSNNRESDQCELSEFVAGPNNSNIEKKKTPDQIKNCKEKIQTRLLNTRSYNFKTTILSSSLWLILFVIIFAIHYRSMRRVDE